MEYLSLRTGATTVHWEENTSFIFMLFNLIELLLELNTFRLLYVFYKKILIMVFLLQNMISIVLCVNICAPNHVQVKLSVIVLNL